MDSLPDDLVRVILAKAGTAGRARMRCVSGRCRALAPPERVTGQDAAMDLTERLGRCTALERHAVARRIARCTVPVGFHFTPECVRLHAWEIVVTLPDRGPAWVWYNGAVASRVCEGCWLVDSTLAPRQSAWAGPRSSRQVFASLMPGCVLVPSLGPVHQAIVGVGTRSPVSGPVTCRCWRPGPRGR